MRRKYKNLCVLGSVFVTFLSVVGITYAAEIAAEMTMKQVAESGFNYIITPANEQFINQYPSNQPLQGVFVADASAATKKSVKKRVGRTTPDEINLDSYNQLDDETERLLKDILNLSSDLAILEEEQNTPAKHQLLVLVTMKPSKLFKLDYVELKIDNHTVAAYNYTRSDVHALTLGGGHRLYLALLPAGTHKLSATMAGRIPRDPDYNKAVNHSFVSGQGRVVVELIVSSEQSNSFPILAAKEWQQ